jgi:splicing factor 3B subunit 2
MVAQSIVVPAVNGSLEHISKNKTNGKPIKTKTQLRRIKQKQKKQAVRHRFVNISLLSRNLMSLSFFSWETQNAEAKNVNGGILNVKQEDEDGKGVSIVEYVSEPLDLNDASLEAFADVFARFQFPPEESSVCSFFFSTYNSHVPF